MNNQYHEARDYRLCWAHTYKGNGDQPNATHCRWKALFLYFYFCDETLNASIYLLITVLRLSLQCDYPFTALFLLYIEPQSSVPCPLGVRRRSLGFVTEWCDQNQIYTHKGVMSQNDGAPPDYSIIIQATTNIVCLSNFLCISYANEVKWTQPSWINMHNKRKCVFIKLQRRILMSADIKCDNLQTIKYHTIITQIGRCTIFCFFMNCSTGSPYFAWDFQVLKTIAVLAHNRG